MHEQTTYVKTPNYEPPLENCYVPSGGNQRKKNLKQISKRLNHIDQDRTKWSLINTTKPSHSTGSKSEIVDIQPKGPYMNLVFYIACDPYALTPAALHHFKFDTFIITTWM